MRSYVIVGIALALSSAPAMAGGKGGCGHVSSNDHPQESISLNYTNVEQTYKPQTATETVKELNGPITHSEAGKGQQ